MQHKKKYFWFPRLSGVTTPTNLLGSTHICGIKGCGGEGCPPPTNNFRKTSVTPTNYISSEREFIGESESSKILGKYFGFAIL